MSVSIRSIDIIVLGVENLSQEFLALNKRLSYAGEASRRTYQTVQVMVSVHLAEVTRAIVEFDRCSVHLLELLLAYAYVVIQEEVVPCFVELGTRFASIRIDSIKLAVI